VEQFIAATSSRHSATLNSNVTKQSDQIRLNRQHEVPNLQTLSARAHRQTSQGQELPRLIPEMASRIEKGNMVVNAS
jgi:hypothetical protein